MIRPFNSSLPLSRLPSVTGDVSRDASNLVNFINQLYHPHVGNSFYVQLYVCVGFVLVILILATSVISHRVLHGRAWFLKLWPVAGGTFVIPNSVMAFLNLQGCFAVVWIAYAILCVPYYKNNGHQKNFFLWRILIWVPLWQGGWWTGFGILSAFPDALTLKSKGGMQRRLILSPLVFNLACWLVPFVQLASILPPAILAARHYNETLDHYDTWRVAAVAVATGNGAPAEYDAIRNRALVLWLEVTRAYWYYGIAMTCWSVWAAICLAVYVPVGAHTLSRIRAQLKLTRRKQRNPETFYLFNPPIDRGAAMMGDADDKDRKVTIRIEPHSDKMSATGSNSVGGSEQGHHGLGIMRGGEAPGADVGSFVDADRIDLLNAQNPAMSFSTSRVFPPMRPPSTPIVSDKRRPMTVEQRRIHNLKRVYRNLSVQYYGICMAILSFFASATIVACDGYDGARRNAIATSQVSANLMAAYVVVLFGLLTIFCIFWRSFDPSLSIDIADVESPPIPTRSKLVALKNRALGLARPKSKSDGTASVSDEKEAQLAEGLSHNPDVPREPSSVLQQSQVIQVNSSPERKQRQRTSSKILRKQPSVISATLPRQSMSSPDGPAAASSAELDGSNGPSLYYVTPYGKVPAVPVVPSSASSTSNVKTSEARPFSKSVLPTDANTDRFGCLSPPIELVVKGSGASVSSHPSSANHGESSMRDQEVLRVSKRNLLAEHGSSYKPVASSFGQWRQTSTSQPTSPEAHTSAFATPASISDSFAPRSALDNSNETTEDLQFQGRRASTSSEQSSSEHGTMRRNGLGDSPSSGKKRRFRLGSPTSDDDLEQGRSSRRNLFGSPTMSTTASTSSLANSQKRSGKGLRQTLAERLVMVMDENDRDIAKLDDSRVNFV